MLIFDKADLITDQTPSIDQTSRGDVSDNTTDSYCTGELDSGEWSSPTSIKKVGIIT